jgi:hypothetical protein
MALFDKIRSFFTKSEARTAYDHTLIHELSKDHEELVRLYDELESTIATNCEFRSVSKRLDGIKIALEVHNLIQNKRLYRYLFKAYEESADELDLLKEFQTQVDTIIKSMIRTIKNYQEYDDFLKNKELIKKDSLELGNAIVKIIDIERNKVYPFYTK